MFYEGIAIPFIVMLKHCLGVEKFSYCKAMKCFYFGEKPGQLEDYIVKSVVDGDDGKYVIERIDDCRIVRFFFLFVKI